MLPFTDKKSDGKKSRAVDSFSSSKYINVKAMGASVTTTTKS